MSFLTRFKTNPRGSQGTVPILIYPQIKTINSQTYAIHQYTPGGNILVATSNGVNFTPTSGGSGFAVGCQFLNSTNGQWYTNTGSTTSCSFVVNGTLASNSVTVAQLTPAVFTEVTVNLTTAQVLALNTTPITLVAAPGATSYVVVDEVRFKMVFNSIAYTGSNNMEFLYTNLSGTQVAAAVPAASLNAASGTTLVVAPKVTTEFTPVLNAAVVVGVPTANPAAGNSAVSLMVRYHVVTP